MKIRFTLLTLRHKNPTYFVGFLLCSETGILHDALHRVTYGVNPCVARLTLRICE